MSALVNWQGRSVSLEQKLHEGRAKNSAWHIGTTQELVRGSE